MFLNVDHRQISSVAIGLYTVKAIIMLHNDTVVAESAEGQGSRFTVSIHHIGGAKAYGIICGALYDRK